MFTVRYQLVPYRFLQMKRGHGNMVLGNLTMQDGRTQTNSTINELPPATYYWRKCEVS